MSEVESLKRKVSELAKENQEFYTEILDLRRKLTYEKAVKTNAQRERDELREQRTEELFRKQEEEGVYG